MSNVKRMPEDVAAMMVLPDPAYANFAAVTVWADGMVWLRFANQVNQNVAPLTQSVVMTGPTFDQMVALVDHARRENAKNLQAQMKETHPHGPQ